MATGEEEKFAGMTRAEVLEVAHSIYQELDENDGDSDTYTEYIKAMTDGREMLKKQPGYYPYLPRET